VSEWQAIVFDLDDTLYPEHDYVLSGLRAVAVWAQGELGLPAGRSFCELRRLFEEGVRGRTFDRWLAERGVDHNGGVADMVRVYREHGPQISLQRDVRELLVRLGRGYRLGLVTDGYLEVQRRKVAALGLDRYFQAVVYSDAMGRDAWKPSPRPFRAVLRQLSVTASAAIYVGDNPTKDFRGARGVGMCSIRVRRDGGVYHDLEPPCAQDAPDAEIATLDRLETTLLDLRNNRLPAAG